MYNSKKKLESALSSLYWPSYYLLHDDPSSHNYMSVTHHGSKIKTRHCTPDLPPVYPVTYPSCSVLLLYCLRVYIPLTSAISQFFSPSSTPARLLKLNIDEQYQSSVGTSLLYWERSESSGNCYMFTTTNDRLFLKYPHLQMTYFERVWRRWVWRNIGLLCVQVSRIVIIFLRIFNKGRLLFPPFFIFFYFLLLKFQRDWISFFIIPLLFGGDKLWCGCGCVDVQVKLWVMIGVCMTLADNGRWYVSSVQFCFWCLPQPLLFPLFF